MGESARLRKCPYQYQKAVVPARPTHVAQELPACPWPDLSAKPEGRRRLGPLQSSISLADILCLARLHETCLACRRMANSGVLQLLDPGFCLARGWWLAAVGSRETCSSDMKLHGQADPSACRCQSSPRLGPARGRGTTPEAMSS